ncbi:hypothetical protein ACKVMT_15970 [Halobacteriales archaeon Cl-PHB]
MSVRRPGMVVPTLAGLAAAGALAPAGTPALLAAIGVPALLLGVTRSEAAAAHVGGLAMVLGVVLAGTRDADAALVLAATVATVVAWDAATTAITLDRQLSARAETARAELVHSGATLVVGTAVGGLAYLAWLLAADAASTAVATLVVGGAVALLYVLDRRGRPSGS